MALYNSEHDWNLKDAKLQINLHHLQKGNCLAQCFAMFVPLKRVANPFETCMEMIDRYYLEIARNASLIAPAYTLEDIYKNKSEGKISSILTIEEGGVVKGNLAFLRDFYRLGVRMICLNWNYENGIGYPNFTIHGHKPDFKTPNVQAGLTAFGIEMVKEMNRLGIIVDVSHLSDAGFYDVLKTTVKPIVASHSNARSVCNNVRNLTDEMIVALHKNGGVMGMNFCAAFVNEDEEAGKKTIDNIICHIKHIKALVGIDNIALGSDFDGIDPNIELADASFMPLLFNRLKEEGFSEEEIEKIAYKNSLRVLEANLK